MRHLCIYKSDRDNKPLLVVALAGYDALYFEKENKRSHVIRLAQPARTTHWFCAGSGNSALMWVEVSVLNANCCLILGNVVHSGRYAIACGTLQ